MGKKVYLVGTALLLLIAGMGAAQSLTDLRTPSARTAAIGGVHAALTDDLTTLFNNPAGFREAKPELSIAEITTGLQGPIFDIAGVVIQATNGSGGVESLLASPNVQDLLQGLYAAMNLLGPISFGYVGKGLGFGMFNTSNVTFSNSSPLTITSTISERLTLCGGYSFRIPFPEGSKSKLDIGVLLKGGLEGQVKIEKSFLEFPQLFTSFSVDTILGEPFSFISTIGFDLGVRYSWNDVISFGLTGTDVFTSSLTSSYSNINAFLDGTETPGTVTGILPVKINAGVMYSPKLRALEPYITGLKIMLDYDDIFDFLLHSSTARNPLLHIGVGAELELLRILSIRVGMYEGLFAAGLGLDLHFFTLNAAMYGTELSSEPGLRPVYNIMIGLEFRFEKK